MVLTCFSVKAHQLDFVSTVKLARTVNVLELGSSCCAVVAVSLLNVFWLFGAGTLVWIPQQLPIANKKDRAAAVVVVSGLHRRKHAGELWRSGLRTIVDNQE